jgi:hypothetical protein
MTGLLMARQGALPHVRNCPNPAALLGGAIQWALTEKGVLVMATSEKVQAAISLTEKVLADIRSAARRIDRLEADARANAEGVLTSPQDVAADCQNIAADLMRAAARIRETAWPSDGDYYEAPGIDIPA